MNKDALLATLIGFGIGLLITGLLLVGPNVLKIFPAIHLPTLSFTQSASTPTPAPSPKAAAFTIESPLAEAIENSPDLLVSGITNPGATVVIAGPNDESVVVAPSDGKFAGKISLLEGKNDLVVTSIVGGKPTTQTVTVYYTEESL